MLADWGWCSLHVVVEKGYRQANLAADLMWRCNTAFQRVRLLSVPVFERLGVRRSWFTNEGFVARSTTG